MARPTDAPTEVRDPSTEFRRSIGYILGVSYPLLAFAAGGRAFYQLIVEGHTAAAADGDAPILTVIACCLYLIATIGFFVRKPWAWWLSVISLGVETAFTLVIGIMSVIWPDAVGDNVWTGFGIGYAFFPFFQPILGLIWLLWSDTMRTYGITDGLRDSPGRSLEEGASVGSK